ncbi:MAG: ASKHA domain-containing protein, partial [Thermodesulfobacteriota bacterium]
LETTAVLAETSFENPQTGVGDDILTRIHYADRSDGLDHLHSLVIAGLNDAIDDLCGRAGIQTKNLYLLAVAGNTTMTHLFLKLPPRWIIREPYIPAVNTPGSIKAIEIGIHAHPLARVFCFPNVGSYFGGDLVSGILYSRLHRADETAILVDVGTNAEVVLGNREWLIACAGAAGPALEGGVTQIGAKAGPGIIDTIAVNAGTGEVAFETIEHLPPKGVCGSALIDLVAQLFMNGILDIRGKLVPGKAPGKIKESDGVLSYTVVPAHLSATGRPLTLSQPDIDNLIRSKAAMYTILDTLALSVGLTLPDIAFFYVAGAFGSLINPRSAIGIGMLPDLPLERFKVMGNSSLEGAALLLSSREPIKEIASIRDRITYLELNVNQDFMNRFSAAKFLPHTDISLFPSVRAPGFKQET